MLTKKDCEDLIEACKAWENSHLLGETVGMVFGAMLAKSPKDRLQPYLYEFYLDLFSFALEVTAKKERSILLQAKLIQMKTECEVNSLIK